MAAFGKRGTDEWTAISKTIFINILIKQEKWLTATVTIQHFVCYMKSAYTALHMMCRLTADPLRLLMRKSPL
jgi:hypothetical protein